MEWTIRDDLRLAIRMGLTKGFRLVRGLRTQLNDDDRNRLAGAVVEHLELANFRIEKGEPVPGHGQAYTFRPLAGEPAATPAGDTGGRSDGQPNEE